MPINQSHELQGAYEKLGLDVTFLVVHGAGHGGAVFYSPAVHEARAGVPDACGRPLATPGFPEGSCPVHLSSVSRLQPPPKHKERT